MLPKLSKITEINNNYPTALLFNDTGELPSSLFSIEERQYIDEKFKSGNECVIYRYPGFYFLFRMKKGKQGFLQSESARKAGASFYEWLKKEGKVRAQVVSYSRFALSLSFLEGTVLSAYAFSRYKNKKTQDAYSLREISVSDEEITDEQLTELAVVSEAVFHARDLTNEPLSYLTATRFAAEMEKMGDEAGLRVEVFNRKRIEALRMGGILAVNRGSIDPPTFTILEWKPENAGNKKPVILVGKGVVFDTGGLNLKATPKSMDAMKCDMAGGAVVAATLFALAKSRVPLHVVGLVPATDNRPDGNAYAPGDVIHMYDGTTVEIANTDAEGRLLLADALSYAKKMDPSLVIDVATLTGSASMITGQHAMVAMGNTPRYMNKLRYSGEVTFERLVEVPLWEEFAKPLKSDIADLNNLGAREGQASIAGKFLEHFTDYPWLHLDIAGVAFLNEKDAYRPAGGTGFGTRLLYDFLKKFN